MSLVGVLEAELPDDEVDEMVSELCVRLGGVSSVVEWCLGCACRMAQLCGEG